MVQILLHKLPYYKTSVMLDNVSYTLQFIWSERSSCWYVDFYAEDGTIIVAGIKLCNMCEMIRRYASKFLPSGYLMPMFINDFNINRNISFDDIPDNVALFYMDKTEYNEMMSLGVD